MIIKLTNAASEHKNKPILLNTRHILSVFETVQPVDDKTVETITNIYTLTQQSWSVKETIEEIEKLISKCSK